MTLCTPLSNFLDPPLYAFSHVFMIEIVTVTETSTFNADLCFDMLNRQGRFCGKCKEGHGLAVYSYQYYSCIQCRDYGYKNWLKYFTVALLPLTLFYILAVLLRLNVTSSTLNGIASNSHAMYVISCTNACNRSIFRIK